MSNLQLDCSACGVELANIVIKSENEDLKWEIYAECPHCGDKSYRKKFTGVFGIVDTDSTKIVDVETLSNNVIKISTAK